MCFSAWTGIFTDIGVVQKGVNVNAGLYYLACMYICTPYMERLGYDVILQQGNQQKRLCE